MGGANISDNFTVIKSWTYVVYEGVDTGIFSYFGNLQHNIKRALFGNRTVGFDFLNSELCCFGI